MSSHRSRINNVFPGLADSFFTDIYEKMAVLSSASPFGLRVSSQSMIENILDLPFHESVIQKISDGSARCGRGVFDPQRKGELIQPAQLVRCLEEGCSVRIHGVQRFSAQISEFCDELEKIFGGVTKANLYITPPNSRGLYVHFDPHDVIVVQILGSKTWGLYRNCGGDADQLLKLKLFDRESEPPDDIELLSEEVLNVGSVLYVPRGQLHAAWTANSYSAHLTFSITTTRYIDVIIAALKMVAHSHIDFRRSIRPEDVDTAAYLKERISAIVESEDFFSDLVKVAETESINRLQRNFREGRYEANLTNIWRVVMAESKT